MANTCDKNVNFDEPQLKVINISEGQNLVLAAPGCGKTAILAERVKNALEKGIKPENMLCLTFTNRAARNMVTRIDHNCHSDVFVGNIHRFCAHLLFDNGIISQNTSIIDDKDIISIILEIKGLKEDASLTFKQTNTYINYVKLEHVLKQYRFGHGKELILNYDCIKPYELRALCNTMNLEYTKENIIRIYDCINTRNDIDNLLKNKSFTYTDLLEQMLYAKKYAEYKRDNSLIDFDDILILAYNYLSTTDSFHKYSWVQIDEVQDLNPLQIAIADLLTSNNGCTLYLGDEQQSIFSFIGARTSTVKMLKDRCGKNFFSLQKNYRSPRYLLDVYNSYAINVLNVPGEILPTPMGDEKAEYGDLVIKHSYSNESAITDVISMLPELLKDGRTAIIVPANSDADNFSDMAKDVPHFKISGTDYFTTDEVQLAVNHLNVLACDTDFMAWAKIIKGLNITKSLATARKTVNMLKDTAITPSDFLLLDESSYVMKFMEYYRDCKCVIFDTETTGLDVYDDDIVQLAAIKIYHGEIIEKFNVIMSTDREIPPMLGDIVNPLVDEYAKADKLTHQEGLTSFIDFARDCVLIGHNIEFDYHILDNNLRKYCNISNITELFPKYCDTLKLARLVIKDKTQYKLKSLLKELNLEGENSHLADDDIIATKSLADYLMTTIRNKDFYTRHIEMLRRTENFRRNFKRIYGELYINAKRNLYTRGKAYQIACEFINIKDKLINSGLKEDKLKKFDYIIKFIMEKVDESPAIDATSSLYEQNTALNADINTFKEADLCDSDIINEKIFISTVHKAKGLEFENVIVFGAVDGTYPHFKSITEEEKLEDARKLYVALSRAKKRLIIVSYDYYVIFTEHGTKTFKKELSPYIKSIAPYFKTQNYYFPNKRNIAYPSDDDSKVEEAQAPYYDDKGI